MSDELVTVVLWSIVIVVVSFGTILVSQYSCEQKAKVMNLKWQYSVSTGCMVEVEPNKWFPIEQYRKFD